MEVSLKTRTRSGQVTQVHSNHTNFRKWDTESKKSPHGPGMRTGCMGLERDPLRSLDGPEERGYGDLQANLLFASTS